MQLQHDRMYEVITPREDAAEIHRIDSPGKERKKVSQREKAKEKRERADGEKQTDLSESTGLTTCLPASRYATGWGSLRTVSNLR